MDPSQTRSFSLNIPASTPRVELGLKNVRYGRGRNVFDQLTRKPGMIVSLNRATVAGNAAEVTLIEYSGPIAAVSIRYRLVRDEPGWKVVDSRVVGAS